MTAAEQEDGWARAASWVALGDSFTEGLDDRRPDGSMRGWADLVAAELAARTPGFRYANLAVRGKRLEHVRDDQLLIAERLGGELVTLAAGGNDILGLRCDVAQLGRELDEMMVRLTDTGARLVVFTGFDMRGRVPLGAAFAARCWQFNASITVSAARLGARVVDLWDLEALDDDRAWAPDRLHLSARGHAVVAAAVLACLDGVPHAPAALLPDEPAPAPGRLDRLRADVAWGREHLLPWLARKVRGRSTGDLAEPKRPLLEPVVPEELVCGAGWT